MDGSHRVVLHTIGVHRPSGITCDYTTRRIYWVDYSWHRIEYSNYDGTFRYVQLIAANLPPEIGRQLTNVCRFGTKELSSMFFELWFKMWSQAADFY